MAAHKQLYRNCTWHIAEQTGNYLAHDIFSWKVPTTPKVNTSDAHFKHRVSTLVGLKQGCHPPRFEDICSRGSNPAIGSEIFNKLISGDKGPSGGVLLPQA